jgi:hypothetical protein
MTKVQMFRDRRLLLSLIVLLVTSMTACGGGNSGETPEPETGGEAFLYDVHVENAATRDIITNAQITLRVGGRPPLNTATDNNGYARLEVGSDYVGQTGELIIQADDFERYNINVLLEPGALPNVVLMTSTITATPTAGEGNGGGIPTITTPATTPETTAVVTAPTIPVNQEVQWPVEILPALELTSRSNSNAILTIDKVEIYQNKRLRLYLSFWNKDSRDLFFNLQRQSYIYDDSGNSYSINDTDCSIEAMQIRQGVKYSCWFEVEVSDTSVDRLRVILESYYWAWDFSPFDLDLNLSQLPFDE